MLNIRLSRVVLVISTFLAPVMCAQSAMAQFGPYWDGYGGWGAYPYAAASQANNVSRELAAQAHVETFNRAQQQQQNMQQEIRGTLASAGQQRISQMQNYTQDYTNWLRSQQERQRSESRLPASYGVPAMAPSAGAAPMIPSTMAQPMPAVRTDIINWPAVLRDPRFADLRKIVENPFRKQAETGTAPTAADYDAMIKAAEDMKKMLKELAFQISAGEYQQLEQFLDTLADEARERAKRKAEPAKKPAAEKPKEKAGE